MATMDYSQNSPFSQREGDYLSTSYFSSLPGSSLNAARGGVRLREQTPFTLCVIGDSVGEGTGASSVPGNRWIDKLLLALRTSYPTSGILKGGGVGYLPLKPAGAALTPWVLTGSPVLDTGNGPGLRATILDSAGKYGVATLTGTSVDIVYLKGTGVRTAYYQVDSGTVTTFETGGNASVTDDGIFRVSLGASGSHTLKIGWSAGASSYIEGVVVYDGDESKGIHLIESCHSGYESADFNNSPANGLPLRLSTFNPSLIIIALGENDYLHAQTSVNFKARLTSIINKHRAVYTSANMPSFMIVMNYEANATGSNIEPWQNYVDAAKSIADNDTNGLYGRSSIAFCDMSRRMPKVVGDTTSTYSDLFHPNDKGHRDYGFYIDQALAL